LTATQLSELDEIFGFMVLPSVVANEAFRRGGFRVAGTTDGCRVHFHAVNGAQRGVVGQAGVEAEQWSEGEFICRGRE
jgi:hypothetical protein